MGLGMFESKSHQQQLTASALDWLINEPDEYQLASYELQCMLMFCIVM